MSEYMRVSDIQIQFVKFFYITIYRQINIVVIFLYDTKMIHNFFCLSSYIYSRLLTEFIMFL